MIPRAIKRHIPPLAVHGLGLPPSWVRYWAWKKEAVPAYLARVGGRRGAAYGSYETIHSPSVSSNPLPQNVDCGQSLPDTAGWWGFSFRDVPNRKNGETFIATLPDCRVVHYVDPVKNQFYPSFLGRGDRAIDLREIRFRPEHAELMRSAKPRVERVAKATWILERVYDNHSHWLTAHLPKIIFLRERELLEDILLPRNPSAVMKASLYMLGLDYRDFRTFDPEAVLRANELTVMGTDRFRPELLQSVRAAFSNTAPAAPHRRIFISRARAVRRRLLNEEEIWSMLQRAGFERVLMEELDFEQQVKLMAETRVLCASHGAGLTNMIFCAPRTHVVEIADLSFPNPNFYAMASALEHKYWLLAADTVGDGHPLERDMITDSSALLEILPQLLE